MAIFYFFNMKNNYKKNKKIAYFCAFENIGKNYRDEFCTKVFCKKIYY
jgi:hypothetical protein